MLRFEVMYRGVYGGSWDGFMVDDEAEAIAAFDKLVASGKYRTVEVIETATDRIVRTTRISELYIRGFSHD
jgi:aryl-alcohol dehydrogenase-like predicted oxidoreductase